MNAKKDKTLSETDNPYYLKETEYQKMKKLKSNTVKLEGGSGIGIAVSCLDKKGNWVDITDYSSW